MWNSSNKLRIGLALISVVWLAPSSAADPAAGDPAIDVLGYVIDVDLRPERSAIQAETEISFVARQPVARADFDLVGLSVDSVTREGVAAPFARNEGRLTITLEPRAEAGDTITVAVFYGGVPRDGLIIRRNLHGKLVAFADNWPDRARQWFPCVDHPGDKATVEFRVRVPASWNVVGVGRLTSEEIESDGRKLSVWAIARPIPTYSMVFGAGELVSGELGQLGCEGASGRCVPISWWMYPEDASRAAQLFGRAREMVAFYDSLIGPFPYEKLALVQSTTSYGGMENASAIFLFEGVGQSRDTDGLLAHEIAHQWFGDAVTPGEWPHLWLSEGLATYFASVFFEFKDGEKAARLMRERSKQGYMAAPRAVSTPIVGAEPANLRELLNANNYQKASLVVHMLRQLLGDEAFFNGIRRYYTEYRDGNALTGDFQRIMEEESGEDLDWFFQQWFYRPGYPQIEASYSWDASLSGVHLTVRQVQAGPPFRLLLDYEFYFGEQSSDRAGNSVWIDERDCSALVILPARPTRLRVDPDGKLLAAVAVVR